MARVKNATFVGNPPSDVDVDSPSWTRVIKNAIGDLALIYDKITGENAEAELMTHDGTRGRGARLGIPWINQTFSGRDDRHGQWGVDLTYTGLPGGGKGNGSVGNDTIVFGCPVFIPPGEEDMTIVLTGYGLNIWPWRVQLLLESDGTTLYEAPMTCSRHPSGLFDQLTLATNENGTGGEDTGKLCLLLIIADTSYRQIDTGSTPDAQVRAYSLFAGPTRKRAGTSAPLRAASNEGALLTTGDPFTWRDFDSTLFVDGLPLHSYLTGGASRDMNALIEYTTGWPLAGNLTYTLEDSSIEDPATSRFLAHTLATLATEPEIAWPVMAQCFGAGMLDGNFVVDATPPTLGMLDWYAVMPINVTTGRHFGWRLMMPDFDTGSSKLKTCTLALNGRAADTEGVLWRTNWGGGNATFSTVASTKLMTAKHTAVSFTADAETDFSLSFSKTAAAAKVDFDEIAILGTCLYFEP